MRLCLPRLFFGLCRLEFPRGFRLTELGAVLFRALLRLGFGFRLSGLVEIDRRGHALAMTQLRACVQTPLKKI